MGVPRKALIILKAALALIVISWLALFLRLSDLRQFARALPNGLSMRAHGPFCRSSAPRMQPFTPMIFIGRHDVEWRDELLRVRANPLCYPAGGFSGTGIVMSAASEDEWLAAYLGIRALRNLHNSSLPVEIFHFGAAERHQQLSELVLDLAGVRIVDVNASHPELQLVGFGGAVVKPIAIMLSTFEEVLWLDADNVPLLDPAALFAGETFRSEGVVLWQHYCSTISVAPSAYQMFSIPKPEPFLARPSEDVLGFLDKSCSNADLEIDDGQMLWNKRLAWRALNIAAFVAINHRLFIGRFFDNLRSSFTFALRLAEISWFTVGAAPILIGVLGPDSGRLYENTIGQAHPDRVGELAFLHRSLGRLRLSTLPFQIQLKHWQYMVVPGEERTAALEDRSSLHDEYRRLSLGRLLPIVRYHPNPAVQAEPVPPQVAEIEATLAGWVLEAPLRSVLAAAGVVFLL
eukprot:m.554113 g.554113  ORF g.554113 m.554113 type:complete len:461 (-) comp57747_c0_seq5:28-1410(-)